MPDKLNIPDTDGKPDFTEGKTYDQVLEMASGAYDSLEELRQARSKASFWDKLKLTWQGKTQVGRIAGTVLDVAELIAPSWAVKTRDLLQSKTNDRPMKDILKRAFTTDGGSFLRIRDENGNFSMVAIGATIIRLVLILGVFYVADYFGLPVDEILTFIFG